MARFLLSACLVLNAAAAYAAQGCFGREEYVEPSAEQKSLQQQIDEYNRQAAAPKPPPVRETGVRPASIRKQNAGVRNAPIASDRPSVARERPVYAAESDPAPAPSGRTRRRSPSTDSTGPGRLEAFPEGAPEVELPPRPQPAGPQGGSTLDKLGKVAADGFESEGGGRLPAGKPEPPPAADTTPAHWRLAKVQDMAHRIESLMNAVEAPDEKWVAQTFNEDHQRQIRQLRESPEALADLRARAEAVKAEAAAVKAEAAEAARKAEQEGTPPPLGIDIDALLAEADAAQKRSDALLDRIDAAKDRAGSLKKKPRPR